MPNIDSEVSECLDILIGCLREMRRQLWRVPSERHQEAVKALPELDVMERTITVLRQGNYQQARENRPESERKYLT